MKRFWLILIFYGATALVAADTTLDLDPARTEIKWTVGTTLHTVHGTFQLRRGSIHFDPATGKAGGAIVVDVPSGESGSGARDRRMHKDILESAKFPDAVFTVDRVDGKLPGDGESQIDAHGQFRIHGADHELTMHFVVQAKAGQLTATTHFSVPYIKWGIKNPSNFLLKVDDHVEVEVRAIAAPTTAPSGL